MGDEAEVVDTEEQEQNEFEQHFNKAAEVRESDADTDTLREEGAGAEDGNKTGAEAATDDATDAAKDTAAGDADPYEGMSEDVKNRYQAMEKNNGDLQHRIDSDNGRVGAFQRKINNLEHDIAEIQKKPGQPSTEDIKAAMGDEEAWKTLEEDYPEIAGAINKRFEAQQAHMDDTLAPVIKRQNNDAAEAAETAQTENNNEVAKIYPKWQDAVRKPEFNDWKAIQSPGVQALAESDDPRDASLLISKYDDFRVENGHETLKADPEPDGGSVDDEAEDEVAKRRAQQLKDGVTIESKKARIDPNAESEGEFEDAFNAFAKRKEAANNRA